MEPVKCPKCQVTMHEREKGGVIIDVCPQCHGVWLDAGELEKLSVRETRYYDPDDDDDWNRPSPAREYDRSRVQSYPSRKEQKGFLQSMLEDFGGEGDS